MKTKEPLLEVLDVDRLFICMERLPACVPLLTALASWTSREEKLGILVGPEGGFAAEEIEYLEGCCQDKILMVTLGCNVLRAETAAIFALSCAAAKDECLAF